MRTKRPIHTTIEDECYRFIKAEQEKNGCRINEIIEESIRFKRKFERNEFILNKKKLLGLTNEGFIDWMIENQSKMEAGVNKIILAEVVNLVLHKYLKEYENLSYEDVMKLAVT